MCTRRILHFVFKVGDRKETIKFYTDVLGMKVLRHEEFEEGCKATCNGPYDGKWSKTMVGYGPEENHFVAELTYNYGIKSYKLGNDFIGITVSSSNIINNAKTQGWSFKENNGAKLLEAPGGYQFFIIDKNESNSTDPVQKVTLACSNLKQSIDYWNGLLGLKVFEQKENLAVLGYSDEQCKLELQCIGGPVNHEQAFGRVAFSCPTAELAGIQDEIKTAGQKILTPLVSLDTPGKATVHVVILADPDGHEICFVGDESFRELSQMDPEGEKLLQMVIEEALPKQYTNAVNYDSDGPSTSTCVSPDPEPQKKRPRVEAIIDTVEKFEQRYEHSKIIKEKVLRPVVIDGSNVAKTYGGGWFFSKGLQIAVEFFASRNHRVLAVVPQHKRDKITDQLESSGHLVYSPDSEFNNHPVTPYDDRIILQIAEDNNAIILSNDNYKDLVEFDDFKQRLLKFKFENGQFSVPEYPLGKNGPRLEDFLSIT